jgi:hypothetical protein
VRATRHLLVDTLGLVLHALVIGHSGPRRWHAAAVNLIRTISFLRKLLADSAYGDPIFRGGVAKVLPDLAIYFVKRGDHAKGFVVKLQTWIVVRRVGDQGVAQRGVVRFADVAALGHPYSDPVLTVGCRLGNGRQDDPTGSTQFRGQALKVIGRGGSSGRWLRRRERRPEGVPRRCVSHVRRLTRVGFGFSSSSFVVVEP